MIENVVELIRRFTPMSFRSWDWDYLTAGSGQPQRWHEIESERRVLIIADPGAGKTFEAKARARMSALSRIEMSPSRGLVFRASGRVASVG
jgi:hypothetical protein